MYDSDSYSLLRLHGVDIKALNALTEWLNHEGRIEFMKLVEKQIDVLRSAVLAGEIEDVTSYIEYGIKTQDAPSNITKASLYVLLKIKDIFAQLDKQIKESKVENERNKQG